MNLKSKITVGIATGGLLLSTLATSAFAGTNTDLSGNGYLSDNNIRYSQEDRTTISQQNNANINNNISSSANTGNNQANGNVGGGTGIETGNVDNNISVSNNANMNYANVNKSRDNNGNWNMSKDNNNNRDKNDWNKNHEHERDMNHMNKLTTVLTGKDEVPGPGDQDAKGKASLYFDKSKHEVCVNMTVKDIGQAKAAHIHEGDKGVAGPVVVTLPTPDGSGNVNDCVSVSDQVAWNIQKNPAHYYVNVHNDEFPNGAMRGQLSMMY